MKGLTKGLGNSSDLNEIKNPNDIKKILICRPNHRLGNQLLITPLLQEVLTVFPNSKIDLFVKGNVSDIIFEGYTEIHEIIRLPKKHFKQLYRYVYCWLKIKMKRYDLVVNVVSNSSSGRLMTKFANASYKCYGDEISQDAQELLEDYPHIAKKPVYNFRNFLKHSGVVFKEVPPFMLDIRLSASEIANGHQVLKSYVSCTKPVICLFTNATGAKCYSEKWWLALHKAFKETYSNYDFIEILPADGNSRIAFKEPSYYSHDIREIASVIANCVLFVGSDSGIMHLASASKTNVIGLFQVTSPQMYAPYGNSSLGINTNDTDTKGIIAIMDQIFSENNKN